LTDLKAAIGKNLNEMISKMNQFHDPIRQAEYLRQSLATDKMRIGLFLGAGCPVSIAIEENGRQVPLIPDICGLTSIICDKMKAN